MNPNYEFEKFGLPKISKKPWKRVLRGFELENSFFDLLDNVMKYSPSERFTPLKAMTHPFFDEIKEEETYKNLKREYSIPDLFDFRNTK